MTLNIQSLSAKFTEFSCLINLLSDNHCSPDFICLQEIWGIHDPSLFYLPNYQDLLFTQRSDGRGGGVGIYVKKDISVNLIKEKAIFVDKLFESIFLEINLPNTKKFTIGNIYRPNSKYSTYSNSEQYNLFLEYLTTILENSELTETLLFGDFNLDILNYNHSAQVTSYIDTLFASGFIQLITKPTRCTDHSASLIDHILTNINQPSYHTSIITSKISDHFPIIFTKKL